MLTQRISTDSNISHGQACITGTRIPAHQIVGMLVNGDTFESLLKAYPSITQDDIGACLEYAALLAQEQFTPPTETVASLKKLRGYDAAGGTSHMYEWML